MTQSGQDAEANSSVSHARRCSDDLVTRRPEILPAKVFALLQPPRRGVASPASLITVTMKKDPAFTLLAIVIIAGVITAFVAPEFDSHPAPAAHATALAE